MIAPNLMSDFIPPISVEDTGEYALVQMHEYNVNQLAVVDNKKYAGLITMEEVINSKHLSLPLKELMVNMRRPFVMDTAHVFDVMKAALEFNVRVVPVIDEEDNYIGIISAESCLRAFAGLNSVKEDGGVLELEKPISDYALSEIAKIVEENDANILCLYTDVDKATQKMQITIKLNTTELTGIISSFERYNYEVKAIYNETEYTEDLKTRYDSLMRYLNV
jgi:signal-transduction protein with cAMP-binding, CBS, and nucleotidyltransferase domain